MYPLNHLLVMTDDTSPQAQDRCHRIGQTKPVMIYRLVTAKTIDQKIVERAAAKRRLEKMIIHSKKFKSQDSAGLRKTMEAINPQDSVQLKFNMLHLPEVKFSTKT